MAGKTIIHLSDLHVGKREKENDRAGELISLIATSYSGTPVLFTGDLTDSATEEQFKDARKLLDNLAKTNPVLTVPGNHDYAWKGNILRPDGWANWVKYLGSPLGWQKEPLPWMEKDHTPEGVDGLGIWEDGPCIYFGIDSGDPNDEQISARGYISTRLAHALQEHLKKHADKTRVALLHHHPFTHGFFTELAGSERLMSALNGNCELLLFGHDHNYGIWRDRNSIPLTVASHKSTDCLSGDCLMFTVIEIENAGTPGVTFHHRIEVA